MYALACVEVSIDHGLEVMHLAVNPAGGASRDNKKVAEELIAGLEDRASDMEMSLDVKRIKYCTALNSSAAAYVAAAGAAEAKADGERLTPEVPLDELRGALGFAPYPAPEPSDHFSTWTRVTSLARARDGAVEEEDFRTAADLQAVMEDLNRMDEGDLEEKARRIEALVRADLPEDYDAAAQLKAELEEKVQRWRPPAV